jgi:hypothetical protein
MADELVIIVGDVVKSAKIPDRAKYWEKMQQAISVVGEKHAKSFFAPMVSLKGDEVAAVLIEVGDAYDVMSEFQDAFHPYKMRFATVVGQVDVAVETKDASKMDGPAFWKANDYLESIKKKGRHYHFDFGNGRIDEILASAANLVFLLKEMWTDKDREIISSYVRLGRQDAVADSLGISQQAVSGSLRRAHWREIEQSEAAITSLLKSYPR